MNLKKQVVVVLSAMQEELDSVVNHMTEKQLVNLGSVSVLEGQLFGKSCVAALSGVGKVASAITAQTLMLTYEPLFIVFTGVGGAINQSYEIGDIVVASDCMQHDMDGRGLGFQRGQVPYTDYYIFKTDEQLSKLALSASTHHTIRQGRVLTGDQFITDKEQPEFQYLKNELKGDVVDMEGASVAYVCSIHQKPYVLVRTISDKANNEAPESFAAFLPEVAENSLALIQHIIVNSPH